MPSCQLDIFLWVSHRYFVQNGTPHSSIWIIICPSFSIAQTWNHSLITLMSGLKALLILSPKCTLFLFFYKCTLMFLLPQVSPPSNKSNRVTTLLPMLFHCWPKTDCQLLLQHKNGFIWEVQGLQPWWAMCKSPANKWRRRTLLWQGKGNWEGFNK